MINKKRLYGDNKALTPSAWLSLLLFFTSSKTSPAARASDKHRVKGTFRQRLKGFFQFYLCLCRLWHSGGAVSYTARPNVFNLYFICVMASRRQLFYRSMSWLIGSFLKNYGLNNFIQVLVNKTWSSFSKF